MCYNQPNNLKKDEGGKEMGKITGFGILGLFLICGITVSFVPDLRAKMIEEKNENGFKIEVIAEGENQILFVTSSETDDLKKEKEQSKSETDVLKREKEQSNYVRDKIIIKFKDDADVGIVAGKLIERSQDFQTITGNSNLDNLNQKFKVKRMRKIFRQSNADKIPFGYISKTQAGQWRRQAKEQFFEDYEKNKKRFNNRAKRVPKNVKIPYLGHIYRVEFEQKNMDVEAACTRYMDDPNIEYAQPDYINETFMVPDDPYYASTGSWGQLYSDLWGLKTDKLNCEPAWDIAQGSGMIVAVIDSGIDYNHEDIAANLWTNPGEEPDNGLDDDGNGYIDDDKGWDFSYDDNDPIDALSGHGTHCAGTIAAVGNNSIGIIGVAPQAKVMAVKGLDDNGSGYDSQLANSIKYAADNGADVLSNSWGGVGSSPILEDAVNYAHAFGCVIVAAAGNSNADVANYRPAGFTNVITVASSDHNDAKSYFSNWGVKIDVAAPGSGISNPPPNYEPVRNILSLRAEGKAYSELVVGEKYYRQAGTSMACPHVSGLAALVISKNPNLTNEEVRQIIRVSADDLGDTGWDLNFGFGRINAYKALTVNSFCTAKISAPSAYALVSEIVNIKGTASGSSFASFKVECGEGNVPRTWTMLNSGTSVVENNILVPNWDTSFVTDGDYTIKVTVIDTLNNRYEDRILVTVQNTYITSPKERDFLSAQNNSIEIRGTACDSNFINYRVEYFLTNNSGNAIGPVTDEGIILSNEGNLPVVEGLLATFDSSVISTAGIYTLRLTKFGSLTDIYEIHIHLDPLLKNGWPQKIPPYYSGPGVLQFSTHTVADINNDGTDEIIIGYGKQVYIFTDDGQFLPGWPQEVDAAVQDSPVAADLDGDGFMEIVSGKGKYVWNHDGTLVYGWPNLNLAGKPIIEDINGDGQLDIVLVSTYGKINVVDINGNSLIGWPVELGNYYTMTNAAVGDVDNDGEKEIVVVTGPYNASRIHVLNPNGTYEVIGPILQTYWVSLVLGDLDGDADLEIIVSSSNDKIVYVIHHDGSDMAGWPVNPSNLITNTLVEISPPTLGDINADGNPEIIIGAEDDMANSILYALRYDGTLVDETWPKVLSRRNVWINAWGQYYGFGAAAIGDVNDDGCMEIIASDNSPYLNMMPYNASLPVLRASNLGPSPRSTPALADVDGDGEIEIIWVDYNFNVFVWDLPLSFYDQATIEWAQFLHDARHTGLYIKSTLNQPPVADAGIDQTVLVDDLVVFDGSGSIDPDGSIVDYIWDFGDGAIGLGITPAYSYSVADDYTVVLTVTDNNGAVDTDSCIVTVNDNIIIPPAAPSDLSVTAISKSQINLTWQDKSDNEDGFKIERRERKLFEEIAVISADITSFTDGGLKRGKTYIYRVRAFNTAGDSSYSNLDSATTPKK
ncbi:MAG: S8 family serine peptidase [Candidatus Aureabacteria bacterium]|nr:S8 family serine peptidase [Candidatus Auribacterota bacterium]